MVARAKVFPPANLPCHRQILHSTGAAANRAASRVAARAQIKRMRAYRCHHCGGWHLTSRERDHG